MTVCCRDKEEENNLWKVHRMCPLESQSGDGVSMRFHEAIEDAAWMLGMLVLLNKGRKQREWPEVAVEFITYSRERKTEAHGGERWEGDGGDSNPKCVRVSTYLQPCKFGICNQANLFWFTKKYIQYRANVLSPLLFLALLFGAFGLFK